MRARVLQSAAAASALLAAACTAASPSPTPTAAPELAPLNPILATSVLRTGAQRVAFLLESDRALVSAPEARVQTSFADGGRARAVRNGGVPRVAIRNAWIVRDESDVPRAPDVGIWRSRWTAGRSGAWARRSLEVAEASVVRDVGQIGAFSDSKTVRSVRGDLSQLTSHPRPDADLYQVSVAESLFSGRPTVLVFASPAFCTTPTCGPQVDTVTELKDAYPDAADYVHVEVYDNPDEIQGDLDRGVLSPVLAEWGVDRVPGLPQRVLGVRDRHRRARPRTVRGIRHADGTRGRAAGVVTRGVGEGLPLRPGDRRPAMPGRLG